MLNPSTLYFLQELSENNEKTWFDQHRNRYQAAKKDIEQLAVQLIAGIGGFDPTIATLTPSECMFRINRDVRFSANKAPYKTSIDLWMSKGGKKSVFAGYYIRFEPGKSLFGAGIYMPATPELKKVRQEIVYCWDEFQEILNTPAFHSYFPSLEVEGHRLSRVPAGYPPDHRAADFLKLKSYFGMTSLSDQQTTSSGLLEYVLQGMKAAAPLVTFFNRALNEEID